MPGKPNTPQILLETNAHASSKGDAAYVSREAERIFTYLAKRRQAFPKGTGFALYDPAPSDVIVTTFPKAGTTLTQQLCYQVAVATGGAPPEDPDGTKFDDICQVVPWLDFAPEMDVKSVNSSPRVFKTHAVVNMFDVRRQKHIVVLRDPLKFPGSWLDFTFQNYNFDVREIRDEKVKQCIFDNTVEKDLLGVQPSTLWSSGAFGSSNPDELTASCLDEGSGPIGPWFRHTKDWLDVMNHQNVIVLFYEDVVKDSRNAILRVAEFMGREMSSNDVDTVVKRCSREYMMRGNCFTSVLDAKVFGTAAQASKVRPTSREGFTTMKIRQKHMDEYRRQMRFMFGVESYEELKKDVEIKQARASTK